MLYKQIIKRGVKDLTFIQGVLSEKLENKPIVEINASEKMINNILKKYGRVFKCWNSKYLDCDYLIYNDEKYSFYVNISNGISGKYGYYYLLTIVDNEKLSQQRLNKAIEDFNKYDLKMWQKEIDIFKIGYYDLLLELMEHDYITEFNPFEVTFINNVTHKRVLNDYTEKKKTILDKMNTLEEEYKLY